MVAREEESCRGERECAKVTGFSIEEFSIPMKSPLQLSHCRLTHRQGMLVRLEGARLSGPRGKEQEDGGGGCRILGVGEVTPLPGE